MAGPVSACGRRRGERGGSHPGTRPEAAPPLVSARRRDDHEEKKVIGMGKLKSRDWWFGRTDEQRRRRGLPTKDELAAAQEAPMSRERFRIDVQQEQTILGGTGGSMSHKAVVTDTLTGRPQAVGHGFTWKQAHTDAEHVINNILTGKRKLR